MKYNSNRSLAFFNFLFTFCRPSIVPDTPSGMVPLIQLLRHLMKLPIHKKSNIDLLAKCRLATWLTLTLTLTACNESNTTVSSSDSNDSHTEQVLPYQDTSLPMSQRVDDLVGRMSLTEKVAQM